MIGTKHTLAVRCLIDFEQTAESLHAHAVPQNVEIRPGDEILVHDIPAMVEFGAHLTCERSATLIRASRLEQLATRFRSLFEIGELYEVGFQPLADFEANTSQHGA